MTPEELRETYGRQLALLVRILPVVARETRFALKGGTAINLFIRELPRLSVDIDLTYLPVAGRRDSLGGIEAALGRIGKHIETVHPYMQVEPETAKSERSLHKLTVRQGRTRVKVETSTVLRGCVLARALVPEAIIRFAISVVHGSCVDDCIAGFKNRLQKGRPTG